MAETPHPLDLGLEPISPQGYMRDIWFRTARMEKVQEEHTKRLDALAGTTNGMEPNPASLAGVYTSTKDLRRELDEHLGGHGKTTGRWWTVALAGVSAVLGAFSKEWLRRL